MLLKDVLKDQIIMHLKNQIAEHISAIIVEEVRREVGEELRTKYIPTALQDQVVGHRKQLDDVKRALHNSCVFLLLSQRQSFLNIV